MSDILLTTFLKRPYVAAFLLSYLVIAWRIAGLKWTLVFMAVGYTVAFASEFCSINTGFPYGAYAYVYENLRGEWLNHGVPVWDSLSYVFMNFAGLVAGRIALRGRELTSKRSVLAWILLSAFFVTLLDVVVDPVAHLGERWFLGRIYYYPEPGPYFDVTIANFAGWYLVSFIICGAGILLLRVLRRDDPLLSRSLAQRSLALPALGLYYGIFAFGLGTAVFLSEWTLAACDLGWISFTAGLLAYGGGLPHNPAHVAKTPRGEGRPQDP